MVGYWFCAYIVVLCMMSSVQIVIRRFFIMFVVFCGVIYCDFFCVLVAEGV